MVAEIEAATDFHNVEEALRAIIQDSLDGMSLVIRHNENGDDQIFNLANDVPRIIPAKH